ncbi:hypothetical protein LAh8_58 [Aeromonas phage LAh_8]|uniref:Uncharacterized protein n=1 Tax=Aeromonas phage LAh_8 TaxID=2591032 RepID=A0A514A0J6_9CAUD|nr:hypothetical protein HWC31_gp058 [Aeromonas phage LAh_8]QDH46752.1 hypothetical protein LAh8_58 [Aeromonas phage LAh_8]
MFYHLPLGGDLFGSRLIIGGSSSQAASVVIFFGLHGSHVLVQIQGFHEFGHTGIDQGRLVVLLHGSALSTGQNGLEVVIKGGQPLFSQIGTELLDQRLFVELGRNDLVLFGLFVPCPDIALIFGQESLQRLFLFSQGFRIGLVFFAECLFPLVVGKRGGFLEQQHDGGTVASGHVLDQVGGQGNVAVLDGMSQTFQRNLSDHGLGDLFMLADFHDTGFDFSGGHLRLQSDSGHLVFLLNLMADGFTL